eukprot:5430023-Pyramimonas_sp.AAC.1
MLQVVRDAVQQQRAHLPRLLGANVGRVEHPEGALGPHHLLKPLRAALVEPQHHIRRVDVRRVVLLPQPLRQG